MEEILRVMKLLIISQHFWPENFRLNDLADELCERGHEVTVLTGYPNYPGGKIYREFTEDPRKFDNLKKIKIFRVPILPRGNSNIALFLNYISYIICSFIFGPLKLNGLVFDRIFVYQVSPITVGLTAILFSKIKKAPIYFWVLDQWPETLVSMGIIRSKILVSLFSILSKYIYKNYTCILGQSESFLNNIKKYNVPKEKLFYFPNWAEDNFNQTNKVSIAPEILRTSKDFIILFAGNVGSAQGCESVIEAIKITERYGNIKWVIVGDGRDWSRLHRKVQDLNLTSVKMLGGFPLERMPEFYAAADALLLCLKSDPLFSITIPGKLQTYLLSGKPILGMLNGEAASIIENSQSGLTCEAENYKCLAENAWLMSRMSKSKREKLGKNGRIYAKNFFIREKIIDSLEVLLKTGPNK